MLAAIMLMMVAPAFGDGPFSKFDDDKPTFEGRSARNVYDIERCLIDMGGKLGAPVIYQQPDRPGVVQLLWIDKARALRRIDLRQDGSGTQVKAWHPRDKAADCAGL